MLILLNNVPKKALHFFQIGLQASFGGVDLNAIHQNLREYPGNGMETQKIIHDTLHDVRKTKCEKI